MSPECLTKPITITTKIPSPLSPEEISWSGSNKYHPEAEPPTIQLKVCSELLQYASPVQHFGGKGQLGIVQDANGQPMIFSIGTDDQLYCLTHVNGASSGWKLHNISPANTKIVTFDVFVDSSKILHIGATTQDSDGLNTVHHCPLPLFQKDTKTGKDPAHEVDLNAIPWVAIPDNLGRRRVSYLTIGPRQSSDKTNCSIILTVGTAAQMDFTATHYTIDPTPGLQNPWKPFEIPRDAGEILGIQPARLKSGNGVFVFFKQHNYTDCIITVFDPVTGERSHDLRTLLLKSLGNLRRICSNTNPWGMTDLVVAGENGIGFVNYASPTAAPILVDGIKDIGFKEVICSEAIDKQSNNTQTKLTLFAVSDDNELYFIQGTRQLKGNQVQLSSSGLPIRSDVQRISCQYNASTDTSELIFVTGGGSELKHLLRDPQTTCWNEHAIQFASANLLQKYNAYVTTVSITESTGRSFSSGFPANIKAESSMVVINDRSYSLSKNAAKIKTDQHGQFVIVSPVTDQLDAPIYDFEIESAGVSHSAKIYAAQRVIGILASVKDVNSLAAAKSSTGEAIFSQDEVNSKKTEFEASATLLSSFPQMLSSVDEDTKQIVPAATNTSGDVTLCMEKDNNGDCTATDDSWFDMALKNTKAFVGDVLEFLRSMVKKVFKFAFKVVGKVVTFVIRIGAKVFSFVIETVGPLVRSVANFLQDTLGLDFGKLFAWLGLTFDVSKTKATQQELIDMIGGVGDMSIRFTRTNRDTLDRGLDVIKEKLEAYIADTRVAPKASCDNPRSMLRDSPLAWLFDNPVLKFLMKFNPISIILEAAGEAFEEEGLSDLFQFPSFTALNSIMTETLPRLLESQLDNLMRLVESLAAKFGPMLKDPSIAFAVLQEALRDIFWTLFDAVKLMVQGVWDIMGGLLEQTMEFLKGKWKLPLVTSLFEWYAEQDFSLLNVCTFVAAQILNLVHGESPWEKIGHPKDVAQTLQTVNLDMKPLLGLSDLDSKKEDAGECTTVFNSSVASPTYEIEKSTMVVSKTTEITSNEIAPTEAMLTETTRLSTMNTIYQTAGKENDHHSTLSKDAKDAIKKYHHRRKWCTVSIGLLRSVTVIMEAFHGTTAAFAPAGGEGEAHPSRVIPNLMLLTSVGSVAASLSQLSFWIEARDHSEEVREELDKEFGYLCSGHVVSLVCSTVGAGYHFLSRHHHSKGMKKSAVAAQCTGNLFLSVGSCGDVVLLHLIPEWHENTKSAHLLRIADFTELVATGFGVANTAMTMKGSQDPASATELAQPIMACALADGILTGLTFLMNLIDIALD